MQCAKGSALRVVMTEAGNDQEFNKGLMRDTRFGFAGECEVFGRYYTEGEDIDCLGGTRVFFIREDATLRARIRAACPEFTDDEVDDAWARHEARVRDWTVYDGHGVPHRRWTAYCGRGDTYCCVEAPTRAATVEALQAKIGEDS